MAKATKKKGSAKPTKKKSAKPVKKVVAKAKAKPVAKAKAKAKPAAKKPAARKLKPVVVREEPEMPSLRELSGRAMIVQILGDAEAYFFDFSKLSPARR